MTKSRVTLQVFRSIWQTKHLSQSNAKRSQYIQGNGHLHFRFVKIWLSAVTSWHVRHVSTNKINHDEACSETILIKNKPSQNFIRVTIHLTLLLPHQYTPIGAVFFFFFFQIFMSSSIIIFITMPIYHRWRDNKLLEELLTRAKSFLSTQYMIVTTVRDVLIT